MCVVVQETERFHLLISKHQVFFLLLLLLFFFVSLSLKHIKKKLTTKINVLSRLFFSALSFFSLAMFEIVNMRYRPDKSSRQNVCVFEQ